jgi:hypothetical protein
MKLNRDIALELMALADGELEGQAKERAERLLETNETARALSAQMRDERTGAWLEASMDARALRAGADGIAASVLAVLGDSDAGRRLSKSPPSDSRRVVSRLPDHFTRSATAALALAAAVALVFGYRKIHEGAPVAQGAASSTAQLSAGVTGVELDEIDSPTHEVSVFEISGASARATHAPPSSSVVIWIDDEPGAR